MIDWGTLEREREPGYLLFWCKLRSNWCMFATTSGSIHLDIKMNFSFWVLIYKKKLKGLLGWSEGDRDVRNWHGELWWKRRYGSGVEGGESEVRWWQQCRVAS